MPRFVLVHRVGVLCSKLRQKAAVLEQIYPQFDSLYQGRSI